jgi:hypothetical protein
MLTERDPHYALGREHGADGFERYEFADPENQRRYLLGYAAGRQQRAAVLAAHPYQSGGGLGPQQQVLTQQLWSGRKWWP